MADWLISTPKDWPIGGFVSVSDVWLLLRTFFFSSKTFKDSFRVVEMRSLIMPLTDSCYC